METGNTGTIVADVAVAGGGPSGMAAALALAEAGASVVLVAPSAPDDPRTTALLAPSVDLLDRLGVWEAAGENAAALAVMRLVDDTRQLVRAPEVAFVAGEIGLEAFGYNIANDDLNRALHARIEAHPGITAVDGTLEDLTFDPDQLTVWCSGERTARVRLLVAADGRDSLARALAGITPRTWTYPQKALVTVLSHARPHRNVSTEFHTANGPFTLVPLPGDRSSLVWMDRPETIDRAAALDDGPLAAEIAGRARHILGTMRIDGPRGVIPMGGLIAPRLAADRVALVGEAAHRFPPIGAQGLNLGLRDVAVLAEIVGRARERGEDPGSAAVLERYDRRRRLDVTARTAGVDLLNRSLLADVLPLAAARSLGLFAAGRFAPLRRLMMRTGLGGPAGGVLAHPPAA